MTTTAAPNLQIYELAVEQHYGRPFNELAEDIAKAGGQPLDLHYLGRRLLLDWARVFRGEISAVVVPATRLPTAQEHAPFVA